MNQNRNLGLGGAVGRHRGVGGKGLLGDAPMVHRGMGLLGNAPQNMGSNMGSMGVGRQNVSQPMYNQGRTGMMQQQQGGGGGGGGGTGSNPVMQQQMMMRDNQLQMVNNLLKQQTMMSSPSSNMNMMQSNINVNPMPGNPLLGNFPSRTPTPAIPSLLNMRPGSGIKRTVGVTPTSGPDPKRIRRQIPSPIGNQHMNRRPERNSYDRRDRDRDSNSRGGRRLDLNTSRRDSYSPDSSINKRDRRNSDPGKDLKKSESEEYDPAEPTEEGSKDGDEDMEGTGKTGSSLTVTFDRKGRSVNTEMARKRGDSGSDKKKTNYFCHACNMECFTQQSFTNHMKGLTHRSRMDELLNLHQQKTTQLTSRMKAQQHLRNIEGKDPRKREYCRICAADFTGTFLQHKQTREHKNKERWHNHDEDDDDEEFFPEDLGDLVTVDTVGFEDMHSGSEDDTERSGTSQSEDQSSPRVRTRQGRRGQMRSHSHSGPIVIPDFDPEVPVGQNYVIPVSGFFCKLCHKFYNNEMAAKITHCQSETHYEKYQKTMLAKELSRKIQMEAAAQEAKPAEVVAQPAGGDVISPSSQSEVSQQVTTTNGEVENKPFEMIVKSEVNMDEAAQDEMEEVVVPEESKQEEVSKKEDILDELEPESPEMIELVDTEDLTEKVQEEEMEKEETESVEPEGEEEEEADVDTVTTAKGKGRGSAKARSKRGRRGRK